MDATIIDLRGRLTPSRPAPQPEDRAALVRASRSGLGLTEEQFAVVLSQQVGWEVWPGHITAWEAGSARVLNRVAAACRRLAMNGTTSRRSFTQAELVLPAGPVTIEALRSMLAANIEADMEMGPALSLPAIRSQLPLIQSLCHQARGGQRLATLRLGIEFNEFCGWLYQDCAKYERAMACTTMALDLAAELDDPRVLSYVLMRESNIATDAGQPGRAAGLANAALARSRQLTPRLRAVALRQKANAHALLGERKDFERARDQACVQAAASTSQHDDDAAAYCTPCYVEMEAGASLVQLGRPAAAVAIFEECRALWPAGKERDRVLCVARLATAYAGVGAPDVACAIVSEVLAPPRQITSARVSAELDRLRHKLAPWARQQAVADFRASLAAVGTPTANAVAARTEEAQ